MLLHFVYCDVPGYEYNLSGARLQGYAVEFDYDAADFTPMKKMGAKPFQQELLDGQMWELRRKYRKNFTFTSYPNLALSGLTVRNVTYDDVANLTTVNPPAFFTYGDLFTSWFEARSRWITTPDVTDEKVILKSNDLSIEAHEGVRMLNKVSVECESTSVY